MTRQIEDVLIVDGERYALRGWPLEGYWEAPGTNPRPAFQIAATNCWRGYRATWTINDGWLCLLSVRSGTREETDSEGHKVSTMFADEWINEVFPQKAAPIRATWFTGELVGAWGQVIDRPMRYSVVHEGYKVLTINAGHVESVEDNPSAWYYQRYDLPTPEQRQKGEQR